MESKILYIDEPDTSIHKLYLCALNNILPFDSIIFIKDEDFMQNLQVDNFYLTPIRFKHGDSKVSISRSLSILVIFNASKSIVNIIKKKNDLNFSSIHSSVTFSHKQKNFGLTKSYRDGVLIKTKMIERYNFGILKNNIQQIEAAINNKKDREYSKNFANYKKLYSLKEDTLFIVKNDLEDNRINELFEKNYHYKYKFISNETLENFILHSAKNFYYLHNDFNQIGITNSLSGEEIFHENTYSTISEKLLTKLIKAIEKE